MNGFQSLMIITFLAAVISMFLGVLNMGQHDKEGSNERSNRMMFLRVFFSFALFAEIIIYLFFIRS